MYYELDHRNKNLVYIKMVIKNCKLLSLLVYKNDENYCLIFMRYIIAGIIDVANCISS